MKVSLSKLISDIQFLDYGLVDSRRSIIQAMNDYKIIVMKGNLEVNKNKSSGKLFVSNLVI